MRRIKHLIEFLLVVAVAFGAAYGFFCWYKSSVIPLRYQEFVSKYSEEYKVPESVIYAVIKCESNFRADAVSTAGAKGLMQIMPETFSWLSTSSGVDYDLELISDPQANIHMGVYYLSWLRSRFGSWELVWAAYNAGHNRVRQWTEDPTLYANGKLVRIPIDETAKYVERVSNFRALYMKFYSGLE
ncbi:MAG: lytic transglycosylase domain-containing protein [Clostridia bacterium]|nr:lytic transglycosylase domain-containing protein [Clostridia bacterium]